MNNKKPSNKPLKIILIILTVLIVIGVFGAFRLVNRMAGFYIDGCAGCVTEVKEWPG